MHNNDSPSEEWRPIPGWHGFYEVSDHGRVRSLDREIEHSCGKRQFWPGQLLRQGTTKKGYRMVTFYIHGRGSSRCTHALVLLAFVGPAPDEHECAHRDGNPDNNHLRNLRWATAAENAEDRIRHGKSGRGERSPNAKLTKTDVLSIQNRLDAGHRQRLIAEHFGISQGTVSDIKHRRTWRHLEDKHGR